MKRNIKIFVFTCVYNADKYIDKLFSSLLSQTSNNFIHYIYDDGSTENITIKVKRYIEMARSRQLPFHVIYEKNIKNQGSLKATQHCLDKIKEFSDCTHFCWINADDWVTNNYVELFLNTIKKRRNYDIYFTRSIETHMEKKTIIYKNSKKLKMDKNGTKMNNFLQNYISYYPFVASTNFLIKNNFSLIVNPKNKYFFNDTQLICLFAFNNAKFYYLNKNTYYLLKRKNSISYGNYFDVFLPESMISLEQLLIKNNINLNVRNMQKNTSVFNHIIKSRKIKRKEIFALIKKYNFYKKNSNFKCKLLFKFRIFCFIISPTIANAMYKANK